MSNEHPLTHNAILYISLGFHQASILQIIDLRPGCQQTLELVVYDGIVYAGARYDYSLQLRRQRERLCNQSSCVQFSENNLGQRSIKLPIRFDVVKINAQLLSKNQPLVITSLEVLQTGLYEVLGREIIPLEQYMKRRRFLPSVKIDQDKDDESSKPSKHFKSNQSNEIVAEPQFEISFQKETIQKDNFRTGQNQQIEAQGSINLHASNRFMPLSEITSEGAVGEREICLQQVIDGNSELMGQSGRQRNNPQIEVTSQKILVVKEQSPNEQDPTQKISKPSNLIQRLFQEQQSDEVMIIEQPKNKKQKMQIINLLNEEPTNSAQPTSKNNIQQPASSLKGQSDTNLICNLYERMHRFRLLCRINHISHYTTMKGTPCTKMILIDQNGDQIVCRLLDKAAQKYGDSSLKLLKGRTYIFQNGEVELDETGQQQIIVPWSGIIETKTILPNFNPNKMYRVGQVESISSVNFVDKQNNNSFNSTKNRRSISKQINICGIYIGKKQQPKLISNQFKVTGIICDPQQQKSIHFVIFVDQLVNYPVEGTIISLHNMKVIEHQRTFKLQSSKKSYLLIQNNNTHSYFSDLKESVSKNTWKTIEFKNISQINYIPRSIGQLKQLLSNMVEHDHCFSQIDCNIANIIEKREFYACFTCHRQVKCERTPRAYCYFCKKVQKVMKRYQFVSQVADSTSSINLTLYSEEMFGFMNITPEQYSKQPKQGRAAFLQLCCYQNVLLRVKSQKITGGSVHYVVKADKNHHKRTLEQIKDKTIESRTKYRDFL